MNRKAIVLVLTVFLLGIAIGAVLMFVADQRVFSQSRGPNARKGSMRLLDDLTKELSLTPEQRTKLSAELEETKRRYESVFETIRPQTEQVRQDGRARLRAVLTPEQLPKFEEYLKRMDERRKREMGK